ncbi:uncharacterized protein C8orf76 homolog [Synchiropus picturatus]
MMDVLGSTFDDTLFSETKDRVGSSLSSYEAKLCEPEWFCHSSALETDDSLEQQKVYKFRGDLAARRAKYQQALHSYSSCLELLPVSNLTIRRDVLEAMARCFAKLGQKEQALDCVDLLSKEATNTYHLTSLLLLQVSISRHFDNIRSQMSSLQQLCSLLPFNPWHWNSLGHLCLQLLERDDILGLKCKSGETEVPQHEEEEEADLNKDRIWLKACMSFIRTRLLLKILQQQQSSFVLQRSLRVLQTSGEALQLLRPEEATLQSLTEVMSEDLILEKMRTDFQDGELLVNMCVQNFRERWWSKLLLTGILTSDGPEFNKMKKTSAS